MSHHESLRSSLGLFFRSSRRPHCAATINLAGHRNCRSTPHHRLAKQQPTASSSDQLHVSAGTSPTANFRPTLRHTRVEWPENLLRPRPSELQLPNRYPALRSAATVLNPFGSPIARLYAARQMQRRAPFGSATCARSGAAAISASTAAASQALEASKRAVFEGFLILRASRHRHHAHHALCRFSSPRLPLRPKAFLLRKRRRRYRLGNGAA